MDQPRREVIDMKYEGFGLYDIKFWHEPSSGNYLTIAAKSFELYGIRFWHEP
jgi:hypothetical protein